MNSKLEWRRRAPGLYDVYINGWTKLFDAYQKGTKHWVLTVRANNYSMRCDSLATCKIEAELYMKRERTV